MAAPRTPKLKTFLRILVSVGILAIIVRQVEPAEIGRRLQGLDPVYFAAALVVFLLQYLLSAFKWKTILRAEKVRAPFSALLRSYMIGNFLSLFLPSSFGGDVYRVVALRRFNADMYQNTSSVLFDRGTGLFALASIGILAYAWLFGIVGNYVLLTGYLITLAGFLVLTSDRVVAARLLRRNRVLIPAARIAESFNRYRHNTPVIATALAVAFLFQSNIVLMNKLYCLALGIPIPLGYLYLVIPLVYLTEAIPITINGLGLREGAFVFFFQQLGHSREEALALALVVITVRYLVSLVLGGGLAAITVLRPEAAT